MKYFFKSFIEIFFVVFLPVNFLFSQGEVYIVLGSDTGIWDGLNTNTYHDFYRFDLYTDPQQNAYKVMEPLFRNQITDSYGQPLKLTWWIMGGNTFRYATNTNVPLNNTMVLYAMQKYHGDMIDHWGDEVSLHYHDWIWSDYNGDGIYFWNQSTDFSEFKEDFDLTMMQFLIEENVYPVSYRSGWHYMNNDWQNYIDKLYPFSLHNDYPHVRVDTTEPLDNTYDWSQSSSEFVPFHPSTLNYQLPGDGKGWDVRSIYMASMDTTLMSHVFSQAQNGIDQVVCIWAHLPEANFLDNIIRINQIVHQTASKFPNIKFRYCTATEAMQRWLNTTDTTKPQLNFTFEQVGNQVSFIIGTNENIFQPEPYVAVKDINEKYSLVPCYSIGINKWKSSQSFDKINLAKAGCAVIDTSGNLATSFINFLPDVIFIDNVDSGYTELKGNWTTSSTASWGLDSRSAIVPPNDSAVVRWAPGIFQTGNYNIFVQVPNVSNPINHMVFKVYSNNQIVDSTVYNSSLSGNEWIFIGTSNLTAQTSNYIDMIAYNEGQSNLTVAADVIKISALISERRLSIPQSPIDFGMVSQDDSATFNLILKNSGVGDLIINGLSSPNYNITTRTIFPITISSMSSIILPIVFHPAVIGVISDSLFIFSNDYLRSKLPVPFSASVQHYFKIVDDRDTLNYNEYGKWHFSNAQAYGLTSRYATLQQIPPAAASYRIILNRTGIYDFSEIVPTTVNAARNALYVLKVNNIPFDSFYINQNEGSGAWVTIGNAVLPANVPIEVKVIDSGENTSNAVLRADAIKFSLVSETNVNSWSSGQPKEFSLGQNYPNPFNPSTKIRFAIPRSGLVILKVYDLLGREVAILVNEEKPVGNYEVEFNASSLSSGIYFYKFQAAGYMKTRKMILLK